MARAAGPLRRGGLPSSGGRRVTRRPPKPPRELPRTPESEAREARALAALLVPPDPLRQLAEWRAKVAARTASGPSKAVRKPAPKAVPKNKR